MSEGPHVNSWRCPNCGKQHSKPHWPDYHQKEPGWKAKLNKHSGDKPSDPAFQYICEVCGTALTTKLTNAYTKDVDKIKFCPACKERRVGIPAPLLCPHCGWTQERIVLVKMV